MFGLFSNKKEMEVEVEKIMDKKIACEELIYKVMFDRLVIEKGVLTEEDSKRMESGVLELYNLIMESSEKIRKSVITNIFGMKKSDFNFASFFDLMKMVIYIKLNEEGKIQGN